MVTTSEESTRHAIPDLDSLLDFPVGSVDVAVHARGKTLARIVREIASSLSLEETHDPAYLLYMLLLQQPPALIVIDAVDESVEPNTVVRELLKPLAAEGVPLIVGARRRTARMLGVADFTLIDLDDAQYFDRGDLLQYVRLRIERNTTQRGNESSTGVRDAEAIANRAAPNFLLAQLLCRALERQYGAPAGTTADFGQTLPGEVGDALDLYLETIAASERRKTRDLLGVLALALGNGVPVRLWPALATELSGKTCTSQDVNALLDGDASFLVEELQSAGTGSRVRLFHEALGDHLRSGLDQRQAHRRFAEVLLSTVPEVAGRKMWADADRYLLEHLGEHAARGEYLPTLLNERGYLVHAEPDGLYQPLLQLPPGGIDQEIISSVYRRVAHLLADSGFDLRASYLELYTCVLDAAQLAADFGHLYPERSWRTLWAEWRLHSESRVVQTGHRSWIHGIALGLRQDGSLVAVTGSADQSLVVWDLNAAQLRGRMLGRYRSQIDAVATGSADGSGLLLAAGLGDNDSLGSVCLWDLDAGKERWFVAGVYPEMVKWVSIGWQSSGRQVVFGASFDGRANAVLMGWDADSGAATATFEIDDLRPQAFAITDAGTAGTKLVVVEPSRVTIFTADGHRVGGFAFPQRKNDGDVRAATVTDGESGQMLLVSRHVASTRGNRHVVHAYDLASGRLIESVGVSSRNPVVALTALNTRKSRRAVAIAGIGADLVTWAVGSIATADFPVRTDPANQTAALAGVATRNGKAFATVVDAVVRTGHTDWITDVAAVETPSGRSIIVSSGGPDRTFRVWDSTRSALQPAPTRRIPATVVAAADGEGGGVVACRYGNEFDLRDLRSGDGRGSVWRQQAGSVICTAMSATSHGEPCLYVLARASDAYGADFTTLWHHQLKRSKSNPTLYESNYAGRMSKLWKPLARFSGRATLGAIAAMPSGDVLVAAVSGKQTKLYSARSGEEICAPLHGHGQIRACSLAVDDDETISLAVAGGDTYLEYNDADYDIRVFTIRQGESAAGVSSLVGHKSEVNTLAMWRGADGELLLASGGGSLFSVARNDDCSVRRWSLARGEQIGEEMFGHTSPVQASTITNLGVEGRLFVVSGCSGVGEVRVWDFHTGRAAMPPLVLGAPIDRVSAVNNIIVVDTIFGCVVAEVSPSDLILT